MPVLRDLRAAEYDGSFSRKFSAGMRTRLQKPLAYAVLLGIFDCASCGPSASHLFTTLILCIEALPRGQLVTNDASLRQCSAGGFSCSDTRRGQSQMDHRTNEEAPVHHVGAHAVFQQQVNQPVDSGLKMINTTRNQPEGRRVQKEVQALDLALQHNPYTVSQPRALLEKPPDSALRDITNRERTVSNRNTFALAEVPQSWNARETPTRYQPPDVAFALLTVAATPDTKAITKYASRCDNLTDGEDDRVLRDPLTRTSKLLRRPSFRDTCLSVSSMKPVTLTQGDGGRKDSFFEECFRISHSRQRVPTYQRGDARVTTQSAGTCMSKLSDCQPVVNSVRFAEDDGRGAETAAGDKLQRTSPDKRLEAHSSAVAFTQLRAAIDLNDTYKMVKMPREEQPALTRSGHVMHSQHTATGVYSSMQILEHNNLLNHISLVTVTYHFPFYSAESQSIAFILVALPPGYKAPENLELCRTTDSGMPPLACRVRYVDLPSPGEDRPKTTGKKRTVFVQVSSAEQGRELPLGTHRFSVWVLNSAHKLAVGMPKNWWFVTFRFSAGHTVTKHFENGLLHEKRRCTWTTWRKETPCSASCGPGIELWTRSLLTGDDGECGPEVVRRKCQLVPCSINCQLGPWETAVDCTKSCLAEEETAFQLQIRRVLLKNQGSGIECKKLYPWDPKLKQGWSDKLGLVVRRTRCPDIFARKCPADLGCRVDRSTSRSVTIAYPWGSCPFPCGGIGLITSIVQVANGIPRWIGERDFPKAFQAPCRADKEPVVTRQRCNTFACDDCSVYVEAPNSGAVARAWFFFLPSQEANIVSITVPSGTTFALHARSSQRKYRDLELAADSHGKEKPDNRSAPQQEVRSVRTMTEFRGTQGSPADVVDEHSLPVELKPEQQVEDIIESSGGEETPDTEPTGARQERLNDVHATDKIPCRHLRASFGEPSECYLRGSTRYQTSQELVLRLKEHIVPHFIKRGDQLPGQRASKARRSRRPEWLVVSLDVSAGVGKHQKNDFHVWLSSSHTPRDPEVFTCRAKTPLFIPVGCQYNYFPLHPEECDNCRKGSKKRVLMLRRFRPPQYGGYCSVPQERWHPDFVLVTTQCTKGCANVSESLTLRSVLVPSSGYVVGEKFKNANPGFSRHFGKRRHLSHAEISTAKSMLSLPAPEVPYVKSPHA